MPTFSLSSFTFIKRLFSSSSLSAIRLVIICISEVIDISPGNLDSSLCFIQPSVSHDVVCIMKEGNGNPLQCSCLENSRDGGAWWAAVYGVTQSQTQLKRLSSSSSSSSTFPFPIWNQSVVPSPVLTVAS